MALDLRAERQDQTWGFVACVTKDSEVVSSVILEAEKQKLSADHEGLYQWTAKKPPRKISLRWGELVVDIPELTWKRPQLK
jgi:hypothetical protein